MAEAGGEREQFPNVVYAKPNARFGIMPHAVMGTDIVEQKGSNNIEVPMRIVPFAIEDTCRGRVKLIGHDNKLPNLPFAVYVDIHDLTPEESERLRCGMIYENKEYVGMAQVKKQTSIHPDKLTLAIEQWDDPETHKPFTTTNIKNSTHFEWDVQFVVHDPTKPQPDS